MPYSQVEQVISEIRCIRKNFDIDECTIKDKIREADDLINGYLGKVYIIPFQCCGRTNNNVPSIVNQISKKLATALYIEWIFEVKAQTSAGASTATRMYDKMLTMLTTMVSRKDAVPILFCKYRPGVGMNDEGGFDVEITDDPSSETYSDLGWSNTENYVSTFDEGAFTEQRVDPNKICDIRKRKF